jgi:hypothetical protein
VTTDSQHRLPVAPNVLNQAFVAAAPNEKWVTDITYILTAEGWLYLACVLDLFSRKIVGWAMDATMTTTLVLDALDMALAQRQTKQGLLHHSDRGSQYASLAYQARLADQQIQVSMSRTGNCYDNAVKAFTTGADDTRRSATSLLMTLSVVFWQGLNCLSTFSGEYHVRSRRRIIIPSCSGVGINTSAFLPANAPCHASQPSWV